MLARRRLSQALNYFRRTTCFWQLCHRSDSHSRKRRQSGGRKCFKCHFSFLLLQFPPLSWRRLHLEVSSRHSRKKVLRLASPLPESHIKGISGRRCFMLIGTRNFRLKLDEECSQPENGAKINPGNESAIQVGGGKAGRWKLISEHLLTVK